MSTTTIARRLAGVAALPLLLSACGGGGGTATSSSGAGSLVFSNCTPGGGNLSATLEVAGGPHLAGQPRYYVASATLDGRGREFTLQLSPDGSAIKSFQYDWSASGAGALEGEAFCDENNTTYSNINKCTPGAAINTAAKTIAFSGVVLNFIPGSGTVCTVNGSLAYRDL